MEGVPNFISFSCYFSYFYAYQTKVLFVSLERNEGEDFKRKERASERSRGKWDKSLC